MNLLMNFAETKINFIYGGQTYCDVELRKKRTYHTKY